MAKRTAGIRRTGLPPLVWALALLVLVGAACGKKKKEEPEKTAEVFTEKKFEQVLAGRRMGMDRALSDLSPGQRLFALTFLLRDMDANELEKELGHPIPRDHCFWGKDRGLVVSLGRTLPIADVSELSDILDAERSALDQIQCAPLRTHVAETLLLIGILAEKQWWVDASLSLKKHACELGAQRACQSGSVRSVVKPAKNLARIEHESTLPRSWWVITELTRSHVSIDGKSIVQMGGADPKTRCALMEEMTDRYAEIARREREEAEEALRFSGDPVVLAVIEGDVANPRACFYLAATRLAAKEGWKRASRVGVSKSTRASKERAVVDTGDHPSEAEESAENGGNSPAFTGKESKLPRRGRRMVKQVRPENANLTALLERGDTSPELEEPVKMEASYPSAPPSPRTELQREFERELARRARKPNLSIFAATAFEMGGRTRYISAPDVFQQWCVGQVDDEVKALREICAAL